MKAPVPADTDLPDPLVLGLTAHHVVMAIPGSAAAVVGGLLIALGVIPAWAGLVGLVVVAATAGVVFTNPDGMPYDRFVRARRRHRRLPRVEVLAEEPAPLPVWVQAPQAGKVGHVSLPWEGLGEGRGVVALGRDDCKAELGSALVLRLSALDYEAMDDEGVSRALGALEAWLNALDCDAQVLVRARPLQLASRAAALEEKASGAPGPASGAPAPALRAIAARRAEALREVARRPPLHLRAYAVLRHRDLEALADRARRLAEQLAGAVIEATPAEAGEVAELLGGKALGAAGAGAPPGYPGPDELERVGSVGLRVGRRHCLTFRAAAYPSEVAPGWLTPLLRAGVELDLSLHVAPEDPAVALRVLRRQFGRMASTQNLQEEGGDLADPRVAGAASDAQRLHAAIGANQTRSFRTGLYLTVWASTPEELEVAAEEAEAKAAGLFLDLRPILFAPVQGWVATRPLALDPVGRTWRMDTPAVARTLPVSTGEPESDPGGALAGFHARSGVPFFLDRFRLGGRRPNASKLIVAPSGSGKSYAIKEEIPSLLLDEVWVRAVDMANEYVRLAEALGGTVIRLGADGAGVNPFQLAEAGEPEAVTRQALFVEALVLTLVGELAAEERAALVRGILACYRMRGISSDPATHHRAPPEMADLLGSLEEAGASGLAAALQPWAAGAGAGLLSGQTNTDPEGKLVVWALADLPGESEQLLAAAVLLAVHAIWTEVARKDARRRVVILDEAWRIYEASAAAGRVVDSLARRLAKGARKYNCGLTNATQDLDEFLSTPLGRTILNNSAIKWLPGQEAGALKALGEAFGLTQAEARFLEGCPRGQGLLLAGRQRVRLEVRATPEEHRLVTSDPEELARIDAEELHAAAEAATGAFVEALAASMRALDPVPLEEVATGAALEALRAEVEDRQREGTASLVACRHRLLEVADGDWGAGVATAAVELAWSTRSLTAGERWSEAEPQTWRERVELRLVRQGRRWWVCDVVRVAEGERS